MKFYDSQKEIQEKILKLAAKYPITIDEAEHYYLMGGDHANKLCELRTIGFPEEFIKLQNQCLWEEKNKILRKELDKLLI